MKPDEIDITGLCHVPEKSIKPTHFYKMSSRAKTISHKFINHMDVKHGLVSPTLTSVFIY